MGASATTGFEHFGQKLYSTLNQNHTDQNIFLSPASIALAISMCTVGAREETLDQMLHALEFTSTEELIKTSQQILNVFSLAEQDRQIQLKLANRLYSQKAFQLRDDYLRLVQKSFSADIKLEDFVNESEKVVRTINIWVEEQTNRLIRNLLTSNDITRDTRLVIINCIYFKGTWIREFNEHSTDQNADFHEANGNTSKIKLMYQKERFAYAENKQLHIQIVHMPYKNTNKDVQFVFTVILPNVGVLLSEIEQTFASKPNLLQDVLNQQNTTSQEILLHIPKFKMETKFELNAVLEQLGMRNAFDEEKADLSGIVSKQESGSSLFISKVVHKAFIDVNEHGTEAAAATALIASLSCARVRQPPPIVFRADRPFLFYIREIRQNLTLFAGKFHSATNLSS